MVRDVITANADILRELIDKIGGIERTAELFGVQGQSVRKWVREERIKTDYLGIICTIVELGISEKVKAVLIPGRGVSNPDGILSCYGDGDIVIEVKVKRKGKGYKVRIDRSVLAARGVNILLILNVDSEGRFDGTFEVEDLTELLPRKEEKALKDISTEEICQELRRRGFNVNLTMS